MAQFVSASDLYTMLHDPKLRRFLGVITLCLAAITTLLSLGFVGVSFATDNWKHISVNRAQLNLLVEEKNDTTLSHDYAHDFRYFDRVEGLFRVCFPMAVKPRRSQEQNTEIYLSPMHEWCSNIEYYMHLIAEDGIVPDKMTYNGKVWIHLARSTIAAFVLFFAAMGLACVIGLLGCWNVSDRLLTWTSILMMLAFFSATAGMGLFHATDFYERNKVFDERLAFYQTWPDMLKQNTKNNYGWSYIIAWFGIVLTFLASCLYAASALAMKATEECDEEYNEVIVNQAYETNDYLENTLRRHGSMAQLGSIPPMPLHAVMTHPPGFYPPGYQSFPHIGEHYPDDTLYRKGMQKEFSDAQL